MHVITRKIHKSLHTSPVTLAPLRMQETFTCHKFCLHSNVNFSGVASKISGLMLHLNYHCRHIFTFHLRKVSSKYGTWENIFMACGNPRLGQHNPIWELQKTFELQEIYNYCKKKKKGRRVWNYPLWNGSNTWLVQALRLRLRGAIFQAQVMGMHEVQILDIILRDHEFMAKLLASSSDSLLWQHAAGV